MDQQFIDRIYECSFVPELWPGVLDELSQIADARGGHLTAFSTKVVNWTSSASLRAGLERYYASDLVTRGQRIPRIIGARHAGFLREHDFFTDDELRADPLHQDFLRPAGLGWGAATAIPLPTGDTLFFGFERNQDRGFIESAIVHQLDAVRPHLARSAFMSARLQLERARVASETLALIGLPALVFDNQGKVLAANHLIEALNEHVRWRAQDRVSLKDAAADVLFRQAIDTLNIIGAAPVRSFAVRGAITNAAMVAHIIPIRRSARDIFVRCAGSLVITPVTLPQAPPVELVQSLFDLTPAEARVARRLTGGETVENIALTGGVSLNTIRTQVRGVLDKTGCRRQAEVVALLGGITASCKSSVATAPST
jgi:DNA-binding CsgD family transcriptional regulator